MAFTAQQHIERRRKEADKFAKQAELRSLNAEELLEKAKRQKGAQQADTILSASRQLGRAYGLLFAAEHLNPLKLRVMTRNRADRVTAESRQIVRRITHAKTKHLEDLRKKGNPKSSSSRGGYRVCARTTSGGWATWTRDKATDLSGPAAEKLMRKLKREGFEVAKFKGRQKVSK